MAPHILAVHHVMMGWWLMLNYMGTPPTHYILEFGQRLAYMKLTLGDRHLYIQDSSLGCMEV